MASHARPRVALLVETSLGSGRDILLGIARYVREHGPWAIYHEPHGLEDTPPRWLRGWDGDGIIARLQNRQVVEAVAGLGVPAVDVLGVVENTGIPLVHVDDRAIGRLGAEHLLQRGFRRFSFLGIEGENWSARRAEGFRDAVTSEGGSCDGTLVTRKILRGGSRENAVEQIAAWIHGLPKPNGMMIASDQLGLCTLEACRRAGAIVPDEVSVVGVDNDEPLCLVSEPPLTSIAPDHFRVGYEAARLLDRRMRAGETPPPLHILPPGTLVTRLSTDTLAVEDRLAGQAARYIREHACDGITVEDVVRQLAICRTLLQRRFKAVFKHTVHDEIIRVRLNKAKDLLRFTELPLPVIAEKTGFRHQEYMGVVFKSLLGTTPGRFRRDSKVT